MGKRPKNRYVAVLIVLMILLAGGYFFYLVFNPKGSNNKYRMTKVERGDVNFSVTATGTINPVITVLVGSQVSGRIKALYADFNSQVKEGQTIAQIDPALFESQVDQARANVLNAQATLANAQANLVNSQANLVKAEVAVADTKKTLDRNVPLAEKKVVAQAVLDTAQTNYDSAQVGVAKAQVDSAKAQVEREKAALRMAETNLKYTTIISPVNGTVISRNVDVGQTVAASLQAPTLFTIAKDLTEMQVDTNVSEADVGRVEVGQDANFTVDAYPERTFRGKVSEVRNAPINVQNVVTYDVVILVENKDLKLKPGMTANVSILVAHRAGVLKISNAALRFRPTGVQEVGAQKTNQETRPSGSRLSVTSLTEALNLTPEQQSKVETILKTSREEIQEIRQKSKPQEVGTKVQSLMRQKLWPLLTEDQKKKFEEEVQSSQGDRGRPGTVWTLSPDGKPTPVSVVLGITDGSFSEVISGDLKEGMEVIVEALAKKAAQGPPSPFGRGVRR
jgi:HlyD family secretion protein